MTSISSPNPPSSNPYIEVCDLSFSRGDKVIFRSVNLTIDTGLITAIMGPSGTGKTTLLKLIGGQLIPDSGTIKVDGKDIHQLSRKALFQLRARMGMLFQSGALFTDMSVFENVAFPIRAHRTLTEQEIRNIVKDKLAEVGLDGTQMLMPSELSGGMKRRIALARAIALNPTLVMYDEPFAGQDPIMMGVLVRLIRQLRERFNLTSVIVSHDVEETLSIADHIYILAQGEVQGEGSAEQLRQSSHPFVRQFLSGSTEGPVPFTYQQSKSS